MNVSDLKIRTRLGIGFGFILLLLIGVAGLGINAMNRTDNALHHIVDVNVKKWCIWKIWPVQCISLPG